MNSPTLSPDNSAKMKKARELVALEKHKLLLEDVQKFLDFCNETFAVRCSTNYLMLSCNDNAKLYTN